jgi:hypothetical protein
VLVFTVVGELSLTYPLTGLGIHAASAGLGALKIGWVEFDPSLDYRYAVAIFLDWISRSGGCSMPTGTERPSHGIALPPSRASLGKVRAGTSHLKGYSTFLSAWSVVTARREARREREPAALFLLDWDCGSAASKFLAPTAACAWTTKGGSMGVAPVATSARKRAVRSHFSAKMNADRENRCGTPRPSIFAGPFCCGDEWRPSVQHLVIGSRPFGGETLHRLTLKRQNRRRAGLHVPKEMD